MQPEPRDTLERNTRIILVMVGILCFLALGRGLRNGADIVIPFVLATFMVYILNPLIVFFERRGVPGALAVLLTIITAFGVIISLGVIVKANIESFAVEFPKYEGRLQALTTDIRDILNVTPEASSVEGADSPRLAAVLENLSLSTLVTNLVQTVGGFLSKAVLILVILLFMLVSRNQLLRKLPVAFSPDVSEKISSVVANINQQIQQYIVMKTFISLLTAGIVMVVMLLFGLEFVVIWGLLTFLLNFIPTVGSAVAVILPLSLALIQFESLPKVAWLGVCLIATQFVVGQVLDPRLIGKRINLSPVVLLFALIFWGWMWGIIGMLLAVPLTVVIKIVLENVAGLRFLSVLMSAGAVPQEGEG
ncbi:MAG: AI-2E family transporter [Bacteroidetes bacterium]|nr:AI-2E family transporter [Bacteroidota bacterium]